MKSKLSLASVLYDIPIKLPILDKPTTILRQSMFPLTYQYRYWSIVQQP